MRFIILTLALLMGACTQAGFTVLNIPSSFDQATVIKDIPYGPAPEQKLDIYLPNNTQQKMHEVIVFFYGGRWTTGAKEDYRFVGKTFSDLGYIVVIPDYQKYPNVKFPVFVQDGAKALAWVYDNIEIYQGSAHHIHVSGHSAGAHIGALLASDKSYLKNEGKKTSDVIQDFVGLSGPYDFVPDEPDLKDMFGPPQNYPLMQAPTFIDGSQPPMLLLYGDKDTIVKKVNIEKVVERINDKGGFVKTITYPDTDHIDIVVGLSWLKSEKAPVLKDMLDFFNRSH